MSPPFFNQVFTPAINPIPTRQLYDTLPADLDLSKPFATVRLPSPSSSCLLFSTRSAQRHGIDILPVLPFLSSYTLTFPLGSAAHHRRRIVPAHPFPPPPSPGSAISYRYTPPPRRPADYRRYLAPDEMDRPVRLFLSLSPRCLCPSSRVSSEGRAARGAAFGDPEDRASSPAPLTSSRGSPSCFAFAPRIDVRQDTTGPVSRPSHQRDDPS